MDESARQSAAFSRSGVTATMTHAVQIRDEFAQWLARSLSVDAEKTSDMVLAVNEALANAAEHAYIDTRPGAMHVRAEHDAAQATLTVWITDQGRWRVKDPAVAPNISRGRGTMLMHALADLAVVETTTAGTVVRLRWDHISAQVDSPIGANSPQHA